MVIIVNTKTESSYGRYTFERIHNMKGQIYFYEKERLIESFKWVNFPGKHPDAGADQEFLERGFI